MKRFNFNVSDEIKKMFEELVVYKINTTGKLYTRTDIFIEAIHDLYDKYKGEKDEINKNL